MVLLPDHAGRGIPTRGIGLFLEVRASDERSEQILRILDDGVDDQPSIAARFLDDVEVFGHPRVPTVRYTVGLQIPRQKPGGKPPSTTLVPPNERSSNGDQLLRRGVALLPDTHPAEAWHVVGRMDAALVLGERDEGCVPGIG